MSNCLDDEQHSVRVRWMLGLMLSCYQNGFMNLLKGLKRFSGQPGGRQRGSIYRLCISRTDYVGLSFLVSL